MLPKPNRSIPFLLRDTIEKTRSESPGNDGYYSATRASCQYHCKPSCTEIGTGSDGRPQAVTSKVVIQSVTRIKILKDAWQAVVLMKP